MPNNDYWVDMMRTQGGATGKVHTSSWGPWANEMIGIQAAPGGQLAGEPIWYVREDILAREIGRAWQKGREWEEGSTRRRLALAFVAGLVAATLAFIAIAEFWLHRLSH